jgi:hypothetical protein
VEIKSFETGVVFNGGTSGAIAGGYRNILYGMRITNNTTGIQVIGAANEQLILGGQVTNNSSYGLDVQSGNSITSLHVNYETNGVHVRAASSWTRVAFGRMEDSTTYAFDVTSAAQYFHAIDITRFSCAGCAYRDGGQFSVIQDIGRNAIRGVNLLVNGGLESWWHSSSSSLNRVSGWTLANATAAQSSNAEEGTWSALLTASTTGGILYQDYTIPPAHRDGLREYVVMGWVRLDTSTRADFLALPQDGAGTTQGNVLLSTIQTGGATGVSVTSAGWQFVWLWVRPNTSAVRIRVGLKPDPVGGAAAAMLDAVTLMDLNAPDHEFYARGGDQVSLIDQYLYSVSTYNPPDLTNGSWDSTTVTLTGVAVGDLCVCTHEQVTTEQVVLTCRPSAADTVTVKVWNNNGANLNIASGLLHVACWKRRGS